MLDSPIHEEIFPIVWNSLVRKPVVARRNKSSLTSDSLLKSLTCILLKKSLSHKLSFLMMPFRTSAFFRLAANSRIQRLREVSAWLKICGSTGWQTRCHTGERAHQHLFSPWHPPSQVGAVTFAAQVNKATLGFISGGKRNDVFCSIPYCTCGSFGGKREDGGAGFD